MSSAKYVVQREFLPYRKVPGQEYKVLNKSSENVKNKQEGNTKISQRIFA